MKKKKKKYGPIEKVLRNRRNSTGMAATSGKSEEANH